MAFQVDQKLVDGGGNNAYPAKVPHVWFDMDRIKPLVAGFNIKFFDEMIGNPLEETLIDVMLDNDLTDMPQGFGAEIGFIITETGSV